VSLEDSLPLCQRPLSAARSAQEETMSDEMSMRDRIEIDRTCQANQRTFLEYLRTGLVLVVPGVAIVYFSHGDWFGALGIVCILIGIIIGIVGVVRFRRMSKRILLLEEQHGVDAKSKKE